MKTDKFYITTTIPYVNADPHIGFALEIIGADVLARFHRLTGKEVFFSTGTDEHGQKIYQKAQEEGRDPQAYVDHFAARFGTLKEALNLSNDAFIRTTEPKHVAAAQEFWRLCDASGDIYKKAYKGLYCVGCELFVMEKDLVDGKCEYHGKAPEELEEENYFFRLSKYGDRLLEYLSGTSSITPEFRRQEAINFVKSGLQDFSISRVKEKMPWGVLVPGDDAQVMYVWTDALVNYISTLGWPSDTGGLYQKFWVDGKTHQVAGKDMIRFQSIMWQAMLMSAGMPNTDSIIYHGFINVDGAKMSKTLGNVLSPFGVVDKYGTDALRYLLMRHAHPFDDTNITLSSIYELYNAHLVNGIGNLTSRIMKMAEDHLDAVPEIPRGDTWPQVYKDLIENFELQKAADFIWARIGELDERIASEEPFKLVKTDLEGAKGIIRELVVELYIIARMLNPFLPETSAKIKQVVKDNKKPAEPLFPRIDA